MPLKLSPAHSAQQVRNSNTDRVMLINTTLEYDITTTILVVGIVYGAVAVFVAVFYWFTGGRVIAYLARRSRANSDLTLIMLRRVSHRPQFDTCQQKSHHYPADINTCCCERCVAAHVHRLDGIHHLPSLQTALSHHSHLVLGVHVLEWHEHVANSVVLSSSHVVSGLIICQYEQSICFV